MKITLLILSSLIVLGIIVFFILSVMSKSSTAPGLVLGKLSLCPSQPNCVCSEQKDKLSHYIEPLVILDNKPKDSLSILKNIILKMGGSIQVIKDNYLAATFSSTLFGFVDDLEIRIDVAKEIIHMRSASRVGYSDMGTNKKRIAILRKHYVDKIVFLEQEK